MEPVTVQFFKYPNFGHWGHEGFRLGEDDFGVWMVSPLGARRWRGEEEYAPVDLTFVMCAPHDGWWHLYYNGVNARKLSHFIDIATQPVWVTADRVEMVDLDLDVIVRIDGSSEIDDQDEFEVHQIQYGYPQEMVERAADEAQRLLTMVRTGQEPFFAVAQSWLDRAHQLLANQ